MEYLKPIEVLEQTIARYKTILYSLVALLGLSLILVPQIVKQSNPVIVKTKDGAILAPVSAWSNSIDRLEGYTNAYLAARFNWKPETIEEKKTELKNLTTDAVFSKLKESIAAFQSLAQNQQAKSYYVLEDFSVSNASQKIEIFATRIIRIKNVAAATPLHILISYQESAITQTNPYGLAISGIDESELTEGK